MAANPRGDNGPRNKRTTGRLRMKLSNLMSKQGYPTDLIMRAGGQGAPGRDNILPEPPVGRSMRAATQVEVPDVAAGLKRLQEATKAIVPQDANREQMRLSSLQVQSPSQSPALAMMLAGAMNQARGGGQQGGGRQGGGGGPLPKGGDPQANMALGRKLASRMGFSGKEWQALKELWTRESGWRTDAANPTSSARGIPQAMMSVHFGSDWQSNAAARRFLQNPRVQIAWGLKYITERYGSPSRALAHFRANNWY